MRVALADDSALFRRGLMLMLDASGVEVTATASTGQELLAQIESNIPDVVIMDMRMPPTFTDEGLRAAEAIRTVHPHVGILVLSTYAEAAYAMRLLEKGARGVGYLLKDRVDDQEGLLSALRRLASGESVIDPEIVERLVARPGRSAVTTLTDREKAVLNLMAEGRSNAGIGHALYLAPKTVETHIAAVFNKLGVAASGDDNRRVLAVLTWLKDSPRH